MSRPTATTGTPDAALLEYLGEFGEAADDLDAMGLSEFDAAARRAGTPAKDRP